MNCSHLLLVSNPTDRVVRKVGLVAAGAASLAYERAGKATRGAVATAKEVRSDAEQPGQETVALACDLKVGSTPPGLDEYGGHGVLGRSPVGRSTEAVVVDRVGVALEEQREGLAIVSADAPPESSVGFGRQCHLQGDGR
jgi:hypothetical protein